MQVFIDVEIGEDAVVYRVAAGPPVSLIATSRPAPRLAAVAVARLCEHTPRFLFYSDPVDSNLELITPTGG